MIENERGVSQCAFKVVAARQILLRHIRMSRRQLLPRCQGLRVSRETIRNEETEG
jgi:hypothetical protein